MSTKRLSKTLIEGGRHNGNKYERRHSHAEVRAEERDYLKQIICDLELADEIEIDENRPVMKGFTDKLRPMYRWMDAQIGRPWDEVRAEVFAKFDTRTTAGRHITFDHLLKSVVDTDSGFNKFGLIIDPAIPTQHTGRRPYYYTGDYYVDQQGIFCKIDRQRMKWVRLTLEDYQIASQWLNGRMLMEKSGKLYWIVPSQGIWKAAWVDPNKYAPQFVDNFRRNELKYYLMENGPYELIPGSLTYGTDFTGQTHGDHWEPIDNPFSFRQRGELSPEEIKAFKNLKDRIREDILAFGKGR